MKKTKIIYKILDMVDKYTAIKENAFNLSDEAAREKVKDNTEKSEENNTADVL